MSGADLTRKSIRDNFRSLLLGNTTVGSRVYVSRINKAFLEELPAIFITTPSDTPQLTRKVETNFNRLCTVQVEIIIQQTESTQEIQDIADVIAGEVEDIILPNMFLQFPPPPNSYADPAAGLMIVSSVQLVDTQMGRTDDIKEDTFGVVLDFACEYYYCRAQPQTLTDFNRFGHDYDINSEGQENLTEIPVIP